MKSLDDVVFQLSVSAVCRLAFSLECVIICDFVTIICFSYKVMVLLTQLKVISVLMHHQTFPFVSANLISTRMNIST